MDNSLIQKQTYLRSQILETGLDGSEFMEFLNQKNPIKGHDLNIWTYEQLVKVVQAFKKMKLPSNPYKPEQKIQSKTSPITQSTSKQNKNSFEQSFANNKIKCELKTLSGIFDRSDLIKIKVTKFEKVEGGVFQRNYIAYTIEVPYLKTVVSRRYSEFVWLKETLSLLYPGLPIPPIAKKSNVARFEDKYLNKKRYILEKFMNTLLNIGELSSQVVFQKFLTVADSKQFQKFKSQYNKIGNIPHNKIKTIQGTVISIADKAIIAKIAKYQQYLKETQPQVKKIYKNFKGAATNLEATSQYLKSVSSNCRFLRKKQQALRVDFELPALQENSMFLMLQNFSNEFASTLLDHARTFRKQIYSLAKYQSLYRINMLQTLQQLNLKQQDYFKAEAELLRKKQKLFIQGKVSKWGIKEQPKPSTKQECFAIMLPKETAELAQLSEAYGVYNGFYFTQCLRHTRNLNKDWAAYMRQFLQMQCRYFTDGSIILDKILNKTREVEIFHNR